MQLEKLQRAYAIAVGEYGVHEAPGADNNERITEYSSCTSLGATEDSVPWCASFVCWCLEQAGLEHPNSARARDFETWGEASSLAEAKSGDIVVLSRGSNPRQGHVGFFNFYLAQLDEVYLIGGNQGDCVVRQSYDAARVVAVRTLRTFERDIRF